MADIQTLSPTAASNNLAPPNGMPEGQTPSSVNDSVREFMAASKRAWDRDHALLTSGGTATALTLTYTGAPPAYVQGLSFTFKVGTTTTGSPTLNVNALGAKALRYNGSTVAMALAAGRTVTATYDLTGDCFYVTAGAGDGGMVYAFLCGAIGPAVAAATNAATLNAAIAEAVRLGARRVEVPAGVLDVNSTIIIGNGSAAANVATASTINNIEIFSQGPQFLRLGVGGTLPACGTILNWTGAAGGTVLDVRGPIIGVTLRNVGINGGGYDGTGVGIAGTLVNLRSASRFRMVDCTLANAQSGGFLLNIGCVSAETMNDASDQSVIGSDSVNIDGLRFVAGPGVTAINISGYTGSAADGWDPVRLSMKDTYGLVSLNGGTGMTLGFTDQIDFENFKLTSYGSGTGAASLRLVGTTTVPSAFRFPQNVNFHGTNDFGQNLPMVASGGNLGAGIDLGNITTLDQQIVPDSTVSRFARFRTFNANEGNYPVGGWWQDGGLGILERAGRNRLLNGGMWRASRGTSGTLVNGFAMLDRWLVLWDGSVTGTWSQQAVAPGETLLPYDPEFFLRINVTAASGNTFLIVAQRTEGALQFAAQQMMVSAWAKFDATRNLTMRADRNFGTGGSPSAGDNVTGSAQAVGTTWARYRQALVIPSAAGKTLGTNGNDYQSAGFALPINTALTFDLAMPQYEAGPVDTAWERRRPVDEEPMLARFVRRAGAGVVGSWASTTVATLGLQFPAMRAAPLATLLPGITGPVIATPGDANFTATTPSVSLASASPTGAYVNLGAASWSGTPTVFRPAILQSDAVLLEAEF